MAEGDRSRPGSGSRAAAGSSGAAAAQRHATSRRVGRSAGGGPRVLARASPVNSLMLSSTSCGSGTDRGARAAASARARAGRHMGAARGLGSPTAGRRAAPPSRHGCSQACAEHREQAARSSCRHQPAPGCLHQQEIRTRSCRATRLHVPVAHHAAYGRGQVRSSVWQVSRQPQKSGPMHHAPARSCPRCAGPGPPHEAEAEAEAEAGCRHDPQRPFTPEERDPQRYAQAGNALQLFHRKCGALRHCKRPLSPLLRRHPAPALTAS